MRFLTSGHVVVFAPLGQLELHKLGSWLCSGIRYSKMSLTQHHALVQNACANLDASVVCVFLLPGEHRVLDGVAPRGLCLLKGQFPRAYFFHSSRLGTLL